MNKENIKVPGVSDEAKDDELIYKPIRYKDHTEFGMVTVGTLRRKQALLNRKKEG